MEVLILVDETDIDDTDTDSGREMWPGTNFDTVARPLMKNNYL